MIGIGTAVLPFLNSKRIYRNLTHKLDSARAVEGKVELFLRIFEASFEELYGAITCYKLLFFDSF